jgi:tetratricopeptide (TPR) repeat protein
MTDLWTSGEGFPRDAYDEIIDRVFEWAVEQESVVQWDRTHARELFEELLRHPPARQHLLVSNSVRFRSWALCELLLEESHTAGFEEPARSTELARLAVAVAEALPTEECREIQVWNGLRARAWAQLGNAHRIGSDHLAADRAFAQVAPCCAHGRIGLLDLARVLDLEASLRRDQRRFTEAVRLLDRVILIYQRLGQWNLLGRALKQKSMICGEAGDLEGEMELLRRALDFLDPKEESRTFLAARHNLISALNQCGRSREAFSLLFHTRPLYLQLGGRMNLLRMRWLEGLVAQGLERREQAEVAFREVRQAFIEIGLDYDAALASLDLAGVLVLQGRTADLRQLAEEMLAVFTSRDIHREALAALLFFCHAARTEEVKEELVREIAGFLKRARNQPELCFTPELRFTPPSP